MATHSTGHGTCLAIGTARLFIWLGVRLLLHALKQGLIDVNHNGPGGSSAFSFDAGPGDDLRGEGKRARPRCVYAWVDSQGPSSGDPQRVAVVLFVP